jgi:hypothetical protein
MKRFIVFFSLFVAVLVTNPLANACPADDGCGEWKQISGSTISKEGCKILYTACIRESSCTGLHEIALESISICGCNPNDNPDIYNQDLVDRVLWEIGTSKEILNWMGIDEIPYCPDGLCFLRLYDRICFSGWILNEKGCWVMDTCPNSPIGKCNDVIIICYNADGTRNVIRQGKPSGDPCPAGCKSSCE